MTATHNKSNCVSPFNLKTSLAISLLHCYLFIVASLSIFSTNLLLLQRRPTQPLCQVSPQLPLVYPRSPALDNQLVKHLCWPHTDCYPYLTVSLFWLVAIDFQTEWFKIVICYSLIIFLIHFFVLGIPSSKVSSLGSVRSNPSGLTSPPSGSVHTQKTFLNVFV